MAHWLLKGMEVRMRWLPEDRQLGGACPSARKFDALCETSATNLISALAARTCSKPTSTTEVEGGSEEDVLYAQRIATEVLEAARSDDEAMSSTAVGRFASVRLLGHAVDVGLGVAGGDTGVIASAIVRCLEERAVEEDGCGGSSEGGAVHTLAAPDTYANLLKLASVILEEEKADASKKGCAASSSAFDVHGIHILMARLTQVLSWTKNAVSKKGSANGRAFQSMRDLLCNGLMRAFVTENAASVAVVGKERASQAMRYGGDGKGSSSLDEEVEMMLGPYI